MTNSRLLLLALFASLATLGARAEDIVTLDDGTVMKGKYIKEEDGNVILKQADGETSIIAKSRVKRMEIVSGPAIADPKPPAPPAAKVASSSDKSDAPAIGNRDANSKVLDPAWANPRIAEMEDLGSPDLAKRKAALEKAKASKEEYTLVMMAMLNPKLKTSEWTRIGILRALQEMKPLSDQAAQTLAYAAIADPYPEARREACRTIKYLIEDRAVRELVKFGVTDSNAAYRYAAAAALNEIDDNRIYAAMVDSIPNPEVTANYGEGTGLDKPKYGISSGNGLKMPLFLPSQPVAGVASGIGSPITDFLKMIAQKDMGNFRYAWSIWYREKIGEIGKDDRDNYNNKRSMRDKMNAP
ncbi:MAG TPA: HEAT repeat domain-containing protein [Planctomycetota bacterium]|nr:HEAT repeat domain-containing protein [Planctomycetota bacterium]